MGMGSQNPSLELEEEMRSQRAHLSLLPLATLVSPLLCQLKFSGGVSSSSSNSNSPSSANRNTNSRPTDVDEKFFFGGDGAPLPDRQPGVGRWDCGVGSWRSGGGSAWTSYPRCS